MVTNLNAFAFFSKLEIHKCFRKLEVVVYPTPIKFQHYANLGIQSFSIILWSSAIEAGAAGPDPMAPPRQLAVPLIFKVVFHVFVIFRRWCGGVQSQGLARPASISIDFLSFPKVFIQFRSWRGTAQCQGPATLASLLSWMNGSQARTEP